MDHVHLARELGEVAGLLHRGVATAHHRKRLIAIGRQRAVAHRARAHAAAVLRKPQLVRVPQPVRRGARADDHRMRLHLLAVRVGQREGALAEFTVVDVGVHHARAESLGLLAELGHHLGARHAMREAGIVLHLGGQHQLTTRQHRSGIGLRNAHEHHRIQVGARGVDGGRPASRAASDDHHVLDASRHAGHSVAEGPCGPRFT